MAPLGLVTSWAMPLWGMFLWGMFLWGMLLAMIAPLLHAADEHADSVVSNVVVVSEAASASETESESSEDKVPRQELAPELTAALAAIRQRLSAPELSDTDRSRLLYAMQEVRQRWPEDWSILPLAYRWAERSMAVAEQAFEAGRQRQVQRILDQIWQMTPLQPGLAELQRRVDQRTRWADDEGEADPAGATNLAFGTGSPERRATESTMFAEDSLPMPAVISPLISSQASELLVDRQESSDTFAPDLELVDLALLDDGVHRQFRNRKQDNSPAFARFTLPQDAISERRATIQTELQPVCEAVVENGASVIIHAANQDDYRWLTVRLTLCIRRVDPAFRLRQSFRQTADTPHISLHPGRSFSLRPSDVLN